MRKQKKQKQKQKEHMTDGIMHTQSIGCNLHNNMPDKCMQCIMLSVWNAFNSVRDVHGLFILALIRCQCLSPPARFRPSIHSFIHPASKHMTIESRIGVYFCPMNIWFAFLITRCVSVSVWARERASKWVYMCALCWPFVGASKVIVIIEFKWIFRIQRLSHFSTNHSKTKAHNNMTACKCAHSVGR